VKSLDTRLGALERVYGVDDGPPFVVVFNVAGASEANVQAAIRQAMERTPGQRIYAVFVNGGESEGEGGA